MVIEPTDMTRLRPIRNTPGYHFTIQRALFPGKYFTSARHFLSTARALAEDVDEDGSGLFIDVITGSYNGWKVHLRVSRDYFCAVAKKGEETNNLLYWNGLDGIGHDVTMKDLEYKIMSQLPGNAKKK